jgi:hypothetical protein
VSERSPPSADMMLCCVHVLIESLILSTCKVLPHRGAAVELNFVGVPTCGLRPHHACTESIFDIAVLVPSSVVIYCRDDIKATQCTNTTVRLMQ